MSKNLHITCVKDHTKETDICTEERVVSEKKNIIEKYTEQVIDKKFLVKVYFIRKRNKIFFFHQVPSKVSEYRDLKQENNKSVSNIIDTAT